MKRLLLSACLVMTLSGIWGGNAARAQSYYVGEIRLVGYPFCPAGWAAADGALVDTNKEALFFLYGTSFGGDGKATFALPNLSGKAPAPPLTWCVVLDGLFPQSEPAWRASEQEPYHYVGELRLFGSDCPPGWVPADGRLLEIQGHTALFALYLTTFGGDQNAGTFALPDLSGRAPTPSLSWCVGLDGYFPQRP